MKGKAKFLFRAILSVSICSFASAQLVYAIKNWDFILLLVGGLIALIFAQYTILNLNYLFCENSLQMQDGRLVFKIGNIEIITEPSKIEILKIKRVIFLLLKEAEVKLLKYPVWGNFLLKSPFLFQFSYFGCHSYPLFFKNEEELSKFRRTNGTIFGEEIVISAELVDQDQLRHFLQDHTL